MSERNSNGREEREEETIFNAKKGIKEKAGRAEKGGTLLSSLFLSLPCLATARRNNIKKNRQEERESD